MSERRDTVSLKHHCMAMAAGFLLATVFCAISVGVIAAFGWQWRGQLFGTEEFSWADAILVSIGATVFLAGYYSTARVLKSRHERGNVS